MIRSVIQRLIHFLLSSPQNPVVSGAIATRHLGDFSGAPSGRGRGVEAMEVRFIVRFADNNERPRTPNLDSG